MKKRVFTWRIAAFVLSLVLALGLWPVNPVAKAEVQASVLYDAYMQSYGWTGWVKNGVTAGKIRELKRLEGVSIRLSGSSADGGVQYRTYVQGKGWLSWAVNGAFSGTKGEKRRVESIQIKLTGSVSKSYDIYYRVFVDGYGWLAWTKNGATAGSAGLKARIEGYQVALVKKGAVAPASAVSTDLALNYITASKLTELNQASTISYAAYIQGAAWKPYVSMGAVAGSTGANKRMEGLRITLNTVSTASTISYRSYVKGLGWESKWSANGATSGTLGQSRQIEAVQIKLTGMVADYCDVYYKVYLKSYGWLDWAKNGGSAGEIGLADQVEAIQIKLVKKGAAAPGSVKEPFKFYVDPKVVARSRYPQACKVLDEVGWDLKSAFDWSVKLRYLKMSTDPSEGMRFFANQGFTNGCGNCYVYAATFCEMALALGYDAHMISGTVILRSGLPGPHGWVEIDNYNGKTYVFDPDFESEMLQNGFAINYRDKGTWVYDNIKRMN